MKFTIPGILITALIVASPTAFAQGGMTFSGTSSNPATSVSKDETTSMTKQSKKRVASKKKHHAKHMSKSKAQTTGSGSSSPKY
jgi:dihydroxyacid dehydratase/phosphogluconate dehydratase